MRGDMLKWVRSGCVCLATIGCTSSPVPLIFDTDIGNDIDDATALAMIHSLVDTGELGCSA